LHVHCILKNQPQVIRAIKGFEGITIVTHDNSFDEAVHWSAGQKEAPDLIFCDEYAYGSQLDPDNKVLNRNKAILEALKEIRFNLPQTRIIILLHSERQKETDFLQHLISLAIYDFHFIEKEFTQNDLKNFFFSEPKTLKDIANFVSAPELEPGVPDTEETIHFQTVKEKKPGGLKLLGSLKRKAGAIAKKPPKPKKREPAYEEVSLKDTFQEATIGASWYSSFGFYDTPIPSPAKNDPSNRDIKASFSVRGQEETSAKLPKIYGLGLKEEAGPFIILSDRHELREKARQEKPEAVILGAETPELLDTIKYLRRLKELIDVPIAVLGTEPTKALMDVGADECFLKWNKEAGMILKAKRDRLQKIWEMALSEASKDPLTGLFNRKPLDRLLAEQIDFYKQTGISFSVLICDLDHFKKVNDTYGHPEGDRVLKTYASFLKDSIRATDLAFRLGGEEFLLLFPRTNASKSLEIAERLCRDWANLNIYESTFSGSIAQYEGSIKDGQSLLELADQRLYSAKNTGRNRILDRVVEKPKKEQGKEPKIAETSRTTIRENQKKKANAVPEAKAKGAPVQTETVPEKKAETVPEKASDPIQEQKTKIISEPKAKAVPVQKEKTVPEEKTKTTPKEKAETIPEMTSKQKDREKSELKRPLRAKATTFESKQQRTGPIRVKAVCSFAGGGTSVLSVVLAGHLSKTGPVAVVDCDLQYRTLGSTFGIDEKTLNAHSWTQDILPVQSGNISLYPLTFYDKKEVQEEYLQGVIDKAKKSVKWLILNLNILKDNWWHKLVLEEADAIVWSYPYERFKPEEGRLCWQNRLEVLRTLEARHREAVVLIGSQIDENYLRELEKGFLAPCFNISSPKDTGALKMLTEMLYQAPARGKLKILAAGYKESELPKIPHVLYDTFPIPEQASFWLKNYHYDLAVVNPSTKGAALLEFDLKKAGVPVRDVLSKSLMRLPKSGSN
jgi:diguanylate cyclase (GGDEF)-like protein